MCQRCGVLTLATCHTPYVKQSPDTLTHTRHSLHSTLNYATAVTIDVALRMDSRHVSYSVTSSLSGTTPPSPVTSLRGRTHVTCRTLWHHSCDDGRRFEDGLTSRVVLCDVLAVWNDSAFTCDCTLLPNVILSLIAIYCTIWWRQ